MAEKRLLFSFAHPDDESFGSGGTIAKYVAQGVDVSYLCATKGDRGTVAEKFLQQFGSIEAVRDHELECASAVLGFKEVIKLGYSDSGMMGTPDNDHAECLWQANEDILTGQVVEVIRRIQPQVIVTFDPYGGYGHPDHIKIHKATTRAFHAAGDASLYPDKGKPYAPQKLYYTSFPKNLLRVWLLTMRWRGEDPRRAGVNKDMDFIKVLENAQHANTFVDVSRYLEVWDQASRCHASQVSPRTGTPRWMRVMLMRHQGFWRVHPERGAWRERDLFAGVDA